MRKTEGNLTNLAISTTGMVLNKESITDYNPMYNKRMSHLEQRKNTNIEQGSYSFHHNSTQKLERNVNYLVSYLHI